MDEQPQVLFDFVMSVGPACRPAQQLKEAGLRFTASEHRNPPVSNGLFRLFHGYPGGNP